MTTQAPTFIQPLQSVVALEGSAATFEAQVAGQPIPEVSWFRDGQVLSATILPGAQISFSNGRAKLTISGVTPVHSGRFSVRATNGSGQATSTAELLVTAETAPPNFTQRLQSMTVKQGSKVRLDVRVTGIPTPVVKFHREGAEIQSSPDFQIVQDADLYSLIIAEIYREDSGTFSVTATNNVGRATSTAELLVQADEDVVPAKKTKTIVSTAHISEARQSRVEKKMEAHYEEKSSGTVEMVVGGRLVVQHLHHKTPPRVPPKPTSMSPTPTTAVGKVQAARQQSPSPVRHVRAPGPSPVRSVSPAGRLSTSPIRSVKSPLLMRKSQTVSATATSESLPPWKQEDYVSASESRMRESRLTTTTSSTQIHREEKWEGRYGLHGQTFITGVAGAGGGIAMAEGISMAAGAASSAGGARIGGGFSSTSISGGGGGFSATSISSGGGGFSATSIGGGVSAASIGGGVSAASIGGGVSAASIGGGVSAASIGGGVSATSIGGGVSATSIGGGVSATSIGGGVSATSIGGGFSATSIGGGFSATSIGGGVDGGGVSAARIGGGGGGVSAASIGGSVGSAGAIRTTTVSMVSGGVRTTEVSGAARAAGLSMTAGGVRVAGVTMVDGATEISRASGAGAGVGAVVAGKEIEVGKKAEAVAKVLAAVDQARTRQPVYAEGVRTEETSLEYDYAQSGVSRTTQLLAAKPTAPAKQQVVTTTVRKETVIVPTPTKISFGEHAETRISQIERTSESTAHLDHKLCSSPIPHFTVSKITVAKPEPIQEVSIAGTALVTLEKELAASSALKVTKAVKPPLLKEARYVTEGSVSPQPPFRERTDMYETRVDSQRLRHLDLSVSASHKAELEVEDHYRAEVQVTEPVAVAVPIEVPLTSPSIVCGLKNMTVVEGESVTLECEISGHPTPAVMWFREDYRIENSIDFQIIFEAGVARLTIREAFAEDSGRFTCTATNEAGTINTSCYLLVQVSEEIESREESFVATEQITAEGKRVEMRVEITEPSTKPESADAVPGTAPFFIRNPTVQKLIEGGSVIFDCQIGGSPKPHVYWRKAGIPLTTGYRYKVGTTRKLENASWRSP
ncbi:titin-like isoform X1 [Callorhinchus milii]|uniref:titin-like isoform X1 n=1 Tax=Callorhinchus milii TaxID=7868 RepID=UPI001C3F8306|nr:titin-like isoform X1 [Callorhinchus milii]